jgi:hypothetical protein
VSPLIFTPEVCARARDCAPLDALSPLLLRWAGAGDDTPLARICDQIERAAAQVPDAQRPRVLGPLLADRATDGQIKATVGVLLLAKMFADQGWSIEFEPVIGETQTPDLLIRKDTLQNIVEVRRVVGRADEDSRPRLLVQHALRGIRTATPLHINTLQVDGSASLKPLVEHVKAILARRPLPQGRQSFKSPGVFVAYEIPNSEGGEPIFPAVFGWPTRVIHGNDANRVEEAINEKLRAYKLPIVVALDLDGVMGSFDDVVDAFYGERKIIVPVRMDGGVPSGDAYLGPMQDGMLVGRDRNAERARERLIALLPFEWGVAFGDAERPAVCARLLANPASEPPSRFEEFAPIPRFIAASRPEPGKAMMQWEPPDDPSGWRHQP